MDRREIIAKAIGDGGNITRAHDALEALHRAGFRVQLAPTCSQALALSLRDRGQNGDADAVDALGMELDLMRRGWGPSTPTEQMRRRADLITARSYLETAYSSLIELNPNNYEHDDVVEANAGTVSAIESLQDGLRWLGDALAAMAHAIPDRARNAPTPPVTP